MCDKSLAHALLKCAWRSTIGPCMCDLDRSGHTRFGIYYCISKYATTLVDGDHQAHSHRNIRRSPPCRRGVALRYVCFVAKIEFGIFVCAYRGFPKTYGLPHTRSPQTGYHRLPQRSLDSRFRAEEIASKKARAETGGDAIKAPPSPLGAGKGAINGH